MLLRGLCRSYRIVVDEGVICASEFGESAVNEFCETNGVKLIVRSYQALLWNGDKIQAVPLDYRFFAKKEAGHDLHNCVRGASE